MTSREACAGIILSSRGEVSAVALRELCSTLKELANRGQPATMGSSHTAERKEEQDDEKAIRGSPTDLGSGERCESRASSRRFPGSARYSSY